ncbi:nucleoside-diphosphate kinase [Sphingomonas sp. 3-13AW]|uniref:nucleoside-diphosphate kinase n=1 Tax=Sphingomonas sp. 3-13AW TaxID=3050450 RepID=UPI003BB67702
MIKPDATARGVQDDMVTDIEVAGFVVERRIQRSLSRDEAEWLYREHADRDHFRGLVDYTISGEVVMLLLTHPQGDAPRRFRELMGPTDHSQAPAGTLRARYAVGYRENSVHGSDSPEAAAAEISRFFG